MVFDPPVIAHRGASAYAPENTLAAFTRAALLGVRWVEFDVMLSADGYPIVFHDERLERTTNGHGCVNTYPYAMLRTLDAGAWFHPRFASEPIPLLTVVLAFLQQAQLSANIELKPLPGQEQALVRHTMQAIQAMPIAPATSLLFSSFSVPALTYLHQRFPTVIKGLLIDEWDPACLSTCKMLRCASLHANHEIVNKERAKEIASQHLQLLCYTVNDSSRAKELYSWSVNAVFSDVPDQIISR